MRYLSTNEDEHPSNCRATYADQVTRSPTIQQVTMDFITDLPISNGFDSIFIMVDQGLSKGVILCPCNKMIDAEGTIKLYINDVNNSFNLDCQT